MRIAAFALVCAAAVAASAAPLSAQDSADNAVYFELGGSGGLWSVNAERALGNLRLRAGFASWSVGDSFGAGTDDYVTVPLTISLLRGQGNHRMEVGGGVTVGSTSFRSALDDSEQRSGFTTLTGILGYRYQKPQGGFLFRAVVVPMYGFGSADAAYPDKGFFPSAGLSFGFAF